MPRIRRSQFAWLLTAAWCALGFGYVTFVKGWAAFLDLGLNELGDFLAGSAAPLAFLWLVVGYLQNSEELQLQREELTLQRQEVQRLASEAGRQATAIEANELHARRDTLPPDSRDAHHGAKQPSGENSGVQRGSD